MRGLVDEALVEATEILTRRRKDLEAGSALLLENETLGPDDFPPLAPQH